MIFEGLSVSRSAFGDTRVCELSSLIHGCIQRDRTRVEIGKNLCGVNVHTRDVFAKFSLVRFKLLTFTLVC